ncbi:MAG: MATE family efflux transporter [Lawsonibacter sp.]
MSKELHLTSGPILPQLLQLCLPLLCANVLQQLYNIINSLVVTRYIGDSAFAALGVAESVMNLFIYVITGACMGASVLIAQFYGEQNLPRLRQQLYVSAVLIGGCTLAAVILVQLFLPQLLALIQTPEELMADVVLYLRVILIGMLFTFTYNYLAATLRAVGDTKSALYFLLLSLGYNLAAAWLLVAVLKLGILGTALATASAQLLSSGLCFVYIRKMRPFLAVHRADMRMDPVLIHRTSSYAAVAALQQSSLYLGKLMIQSAVNGISLVSTAPISAFTAATRVENFTQAFGISGCESIAIFVAQNQGAGSIAGP